MTIRTTRRTTSTALAALLALVPTAPPSRSSPRIVSLQTFQGIVLTLADAKQARDLVNVLVESKQKIDPRLDEMARYGGGGGGGRGGYRGRGGGRGHGGGNYSR
jgi:hypothetical protein